MAKPKLVYVCSACGAESLRWAGQCADCGAWNTQQESTRPTGGPAARASAWTGAAAARRPLKDLEAVGADRIPSGFEELDRVLGGGLTAGSVVLIGGDPGIGKSTLLLQAAAELSRHGVVLYATGEESLDQVGLRARRLGVAGAAVQLLAETCVERVVAAARADQPRVLVIDSIQTMYSESSPGAAGAVSQLRECAAQLVRLAKEGGPAVFLVGHVTKDGQLAGPRVLEHMVDTVLYFENDTASRYRVMRSVKNRFGPVNELGVFAMTEDGIREVKNPSAIFLTRHPKPVPGSVITVTREGTRPLLCEVQALVAETQASNPRRVAVGMEHNRLALLLAVLQRHAGVAMYDQDVFVNVVGGLTVNETALDLPVLLAVLSSVRNRAVPAELVAFGEVGLAGEVRPVRAGEERLREAAKQGFRRALVPVANAPRKAIEGLEVQAVASVHEVLALV
jgi:DNA repair protein RadA/Sms